MCHSHDTATPGDFTESIVYHNNKLEDKNEIPMETDLHPYRGTTVAVRDTDTKPESEWGSIQKCIDWEVSMRTFKITYDAVTDKMRLEKKDPLCNCRNGVISMIDACDHCKKAYNNYLDWICGCEDERDDYEED